MLPHYREVMCDEDCIEDQDQEEYRSLWEMLQGPVQDTVRPGALLTLRPLMAS